MYGVPIQSKNKYLEVKRFIEHLTKISKTLKVIVGEDYGYYGSFGFEKRMVSTVISKNIINDCKEVMSMDENEIIIRDSIKEKLK